MTKARVNADNASADIQGVTAGTGLTGGGTSGTVTLTNGMATAITTKGDLIVGTGSGTFVREPVGTNNQVLMADSAQAEGVKYANEATATLTTTGDLLYASAANTLARRGIGSTGQVLTVSGGVPDWTTISAGAYTQLATGSLSGTSVTLSSISSSYKKLVLVLNNVSLSGSDEIIFQMNGVTSGTYSFISWRGGAIAGQSANSAIGIKIPAGNLSNTDTTYRCVIEFDDYATSGPTISTNYGWINTTSTTSGTQIFSGVGGNSTAAVVSSITLRADYGNPSFTFDNGTYTLFGVK
jgi:hypothetical protein